MPKYFKKIYIKMPKNFWAGDQYIGISMARKLAAVLPTSLIISIVRVFSTTKASLHIIRVFSPTKTSRQTVIKTK